MKKKTRIKINTSLKIYFKVFLSFFFNKGKKNNIYFERVLKKFLYTENLLLTSQGRVAAYNIFKVIVSEKKKEILISPYTLTEVINAIMYAGGIPVYVDINLKNGLPLEKDLEEKINENTVGLVLTHLYSNREDILSFHKKFHKKITIIEDVAINFGAKIEKNKFLGTVFDYGFYSFGVMKNLCTFHGGAIVCQNKKKFYEIEKNLKKNIDYPIISTLKLLFFCMLIDFFYSKYVFNYFTYYILNIPNNILDKLMYPGVFPKFYKSTPKHYFYKFQKHFAISGIENLKTIDAISKRRNEKVKLYEIYLRKDLLINNFNFREINSFLEYPILLKKNSNKFLSKMLLKKGFDIRHTWYVNSARYLKLNNKFNNIINCEYLHDKVLSLPTHDHILEQDIIKICKLINFYEKKTNQS